LKKGPNKKAATESAFLGGKVVRIALPIVRDTTKPAIPLLKRLELAQGELAQFYDSAEGMRYLAAIELREDGIRGNHYHHVKEEWLYVIQGRVSLRVEDMQTHDRATVALRAGDLAIVRTGVAHTLRTVQPGWAIEFSPARFNAADIHRLAGDSTKAGPGKLKLPARKRR
jgi:mannose-6-phosphate isomerase-like protein (cupin superfamily)